jgi:hypothetical protein
VVKMLDLVLEVVVSQFVGHGVRGV